MLKVRVFILAVTFFSIVNINAGNRLYMKDFTVYSDGAKRVKVILENDTEFTAFQTDIRLPKGLSVEQIDGEYSFELTGRANPDQVISCLMRPDGAIRVLSYSLTLSPFTGFAGPIMTFVVDVGDDFMDTDTISFSNTLFTKVNGDEVALPNEECTVMMIMKGDVNNDREVSIADLNMVIAVILGYGEHSDLTCSAADVNEDGEVTISDINAIIDIILKKS